MTCDQAMDAYLRLDNGEELTRDLTNHISACDGCRRQVAVLRRVFSALQATTLVDAPEGATDAIMASIRLTGENEEPLSLAKWLATGVIIFASIVLVSFSNSHSWLSDAFGMSLDLPLSIILGAAITIYVTLFVGTHIDKVAGFFGLDHQRRS